MPDSNLPRWGRTVLRVVSTVLYAMTCALGVVGLAWPPVHPDAGAAQQALLVAAAVVLVASGAACAYATIAHRWRLELLAVWWVGAGLVAYVAGTWSQKPMTPMGALFMLATCALSLALLHRGISLTIFAQRTHVERSRRLRAA